MKRNHTTKREARSRPRTKYADKRKANRQMYSSLGFSCCGHSRKSTVQDQRKER